MVVYLYASNWHIQLQHIRVELSSSHHLFLMIASLSGFSFLAYLAVAGVVFGVALVKMALDLLVDYTFRITKRYGDIYEHFSNIFTLVSVALYLLLLLFMRIDSLVATRWMLGLMAGVFFLLWAYRCVRQYVHSPMATAYLLIYMTTLEFLPLAGIALLSAKTISLI